MSANHPDFEKLRQLVDRTGIAMLVTTDPHGELRSRPVQTLEFDPQGRLWFFTAAESPKVREIDEHRGQVNLAYADPSRGNYASISGVARFYRDAERARQLWSKPAEIWFPDGPTDPSLLLLQVSIEQAEYWDSPDSPVLRLWGMAKALVTGDDAPLGENRKLGRREVHSDAQSRVQPRDSGPHPLQYR